MYFSKYAKRSIKFNIEAYKPQKTSWNLFITVLKIYELWLSISFCPRKESNEVEF